jgi:hypothetical protein
MKRWRHLSQSSRWPSGWLKHRESFAFLLGSGVSRDAGIPTGGDVLAIPQGDLYRVSAGETETPPTEDLDDWLGEHGHAELGYSEILELLAPDAEGRRAYLTKQFEGREPGEAHRLLAALAANGLVRVFVTTNFDRLRERALAEHGITPIVVTSDDDLRRATQREQAACYALKPHGDYLQQTVRNSPDELARIDPGLEVEKQEVFDRFGVVILAYSGSDKALGGILRGRESGGGNDRKRRLAVRGGLHADLLDPGERPFGRDHGDGHDREPRRRRLRGLERPAGLVPAGCERGRRCRDVGWHLRLHRNCRYGQRRPARAGPAPAFTIAFGKGVEKA